VRGRRGRGPGGPGAHPKFTGGLGLAGGGPPAAAADICGGISVGGGYFGVRGSIELAGR
jgi:hypothetical protein